MKNKKKSYCMVLAPPVRPGLAVGRPDDGVDAPGGASELLAAWAKVVDEGGRGGEADEGGSPAGAAWELLRRLTHPEFCVLCTSTIYHTYRQIQLLTFTYINVRPYCCCLREVGRIQRHLVRTYVVLRYGMYGRVRCTGTCTVVWENYYCFIFLANKRNSFRRP